MAAADNPFYIKPVNAMEALMSGYEGYDRANKAGRERQMQEGRQRAMQALQAGGDLRGPLADLIGIGDDKAATALGHYAANAESSRHNMTMEELTREANRAGKTQYLKTTDPFGGEGYIRVSPDQPPQRVEVPAAAGGGADVGFDASKIDENLTGHEYLAQFPKNVQASVKNYLEGQTMPTGNPRMKGFNTKVKEIAQRVGNDIGIPADDATFARRRQFLTQLSSSNPSSVGGQRNALQTAIGHANDVIRYATDLGNYDTGIPLLSRGVNALRQASSTEQAAKVNKLNEGVDRLAGEIGKLYSGSQGGGVGEREATRSRFAGSKSGPELAGAAEAAVEMLTSRLHALEAQRDELNVPAHRAEFLSKATKAKMEELQRNLQILKGNIKPPTNPQFQAPEKSQEKLPPGVPPPPPGAVLNR